jgi:hypothetical protein
MDFPIKNNKIELYEASVGKINQERCLARIWAGGFGAQCSHIRDDGCLCSLHQKGNLWFGLVNGPRPEYPVKNGNILKWQPEHICAQVKACARVRTYQRLEARTE